MKLYIYLFKLNVFVFLICCGSFIFFALTSLHYYIRDIKSKDHFQKKYVKVDAYHLLPGDGSASDWPVFTLNGEYKGIVSREKLAIDSFYYVWYNTKNEFAYLTTKESKQYNVYKIRLDMWIGICSFLLSCFTFLSMHYLRRFLIKKNI